MTPATAKKNIIYVFAPQGTTQQGMGTDFFNKESPYRDTFMPLIEKGDQIGRSLVPGYTSIGAICAANEEQQMLPSNTHMGMYWLSLGITLAFEQAAQKAGIPLNVLATTGPSLGMYAALTAAGIAGAFKEDTNRLDHIGSLVATRDRVQDEWQTRLDAYLNSGGILKYPFNPAGGYKMAAISGLTEDVANEVATLAGVYITNVNDNKLINIAGQVRDMANATMFAEQRGGKVIYLKVGAPFHSQLMVGSQYGLDHYVQESRVASHLNPSVVPVVSDLNKGYVNAIEFVQNAGSHILSTVRFSDTTNTIADLLREQEQAYVVACSPSQAGAKAIERLLQNKVPNNKKRVFQVFSPKTLQSAIDQLAE